MIFGAKKNPFIRKTTIRIKKSIHTFLFVILHQEPVWVYNHILSFLIEHGGVEAICQCRFHPQKILMWLWVKPSAIKI